MRIVHVTNFYGRQSNQQINQMNNSALAHQSAGNEFIAIIPSFQLATIETSFGKIINLPSIRVPFTNGRRLILSQRLLKNILVALDPDEIEVIDQQYLDGFKKWAIKRSLKVHTEIRPIDFLQHKSRDAQEAQDALAMENFFHNRAKNFSIPA
jgi:hypothetical protein